MEIIERDVTVLTLDDGKCPFAEWFLSLKDLRTRLRISARITRLQSGNLGDVRSVGESVSELKMDFGPGYRIYFAVSGQTVIVLLAGGDKSTQNKDIQAAQRLWKENRDAIERFRRDFGA